MNKIDQLKQAVAKLETDLFALQSAESERSQWEDNDLTRRDGSSAQDARNDAIGRDASTRVMEAKHEVKLQKALVEKLASAI